MNINFSQKTGRLTQDDGTYIALGWAGNGIGKLNPDAESMVAIGPLPRGTYQVGEWEDQHPHLGPMVAALTQISGDTFGRSAFYIHGPAVDPVLYGQESKGCIVVPHFGRLAIKDLAPDTVTVMA